MLWIIILVFAFLVLVVSRKKRERTEKLEVGTNSLVYLLEILIVTSVIVNILFKQNTFWSYNNLLQIDVLRDYVFAFTLYQLMLMVVFRLKDSIDIDANNALKSAIDKFQLYGEFEKEIPSEELEEFNMKKDMAFFNEEQLKIFERINFIISDYNNEIISKNAFRMALKSISIDLDLNIKISSYGWMQSVVLRWIKLSDENSGKGEMKMNIVRTNEVFDHNEKVYNARIDTYFRNGIEENNAVVFSYKGIDVSKSFGEGEFFNKVAKAECELIDKLGEQNYKTYTKNRSRISSLKKEYIVVNNKVFNYFMDDSTKSGLSTYYMLGIDMTDGTTFDGSNASSFFADKESTNKKMSLNNLRNRVLKHFRDTGAEPVEKYLMVDLTKEFQEKQEWNKQILNN